MKIDRHIITQAHDAKSKIAPIVESLNELTDYHFRYDDDNVFEEVKKIISLLGKKIDTADATINEGQAIYDSRDQALINYVVHRGTKIPTEIESLGKSAISITENYKAKVAGLTTQRYSLEEIERIIPIEEHNKKLSDNAAEIATLQRDHAALQRFVSDTPNYDVGIIKNTQFYKYFLDNEEYFRGLRN